MSRLCKRIARAALAVLAVSWALVFDTAAADPAAVPRSTAADQPVVVLLSWDGVRHDFPDRAELPGLARLARRGVRAGRLVPVFPSNTFPTHVSMATGTYPDRHGIIDNRFYDRERGPYRPGAPANWIEAEPLWVAAERQGVPAATYFWVGSDSDWRGRHARFQHAPFDPDRPESAKVEQILEWLALPAEQRPRLIMSYWAGADSAGHLHGPDSQEVVERLVEQDRQLQRLLAGMDALDVWGYTTLIVVSDHGMAPTGAWIDLAGALAEAGIEARVTGTGVAQVYLADPAQVDEALAVIAELEPVRVWRGDALPAALRLSHATRTGDLVALTEPPYSFSRPAGLEGIAQTWLHRFGRQFGGHGYLPGHPDMGGIFFAAGRGVPADLLLPAVHQVDVAATVARLLGMDPPQQSEGRAIPGIGEHLLTRPKAQSGGRPPHDDQRAGSGSSASARPATRCSTSRITAPSTGRAAAAIAATTAE